MAVSGNPQQYIAAVLRGIHAPVTAANVHALLAWGRAEGGGARWNLMNTTQPMTGASNYNSIGVKNYASMQQGVAATVKTLLNGHYAPILAALHKGTNPLSVAAAVGASPWGTSGTLMASILHGSLPKVNPQLAGAGGMPGSGPRPEMPPTFLHPTTQPFQPMAFLPPVPPTFANPAPKPRDALAALFPVRAPSAQAPGAPLDLASLAPSGYDRQVQGIHDALLRATS